jgi:GNAT superfamily N-acetyltransferase
MVRIREMTVADVPAVSALRVRGWQAAYVGIVPQEYLDGMDPAADAERRRRSLAEPAGRMSNLVAEDIPDAPDTMTAQDTQDTQDTMAPGGGDAVVGWAAFGPYRGEEAGSSTWELYALYVRPERIGTGVGRALVAEVVRRTAERGRDRLALWVLADNARARRFYAAAGFGPDGATMTELYGGTAVHEVRYVRALR